MSEDTNTTGVMPNDGAESPSPSEPQVFSADYVKQLRSEAADWRKKLRDAEAALSEKQAREKAEEEKKLAEQGHYKTLLEQREAELAELRAQMEREKVMGLKMRIGVEAGLPQALIERLNGASEEELRADAEKLKPLIASQAPRTTTSATPGGNPPAGETYEQKIARLYRGGGRSSVFGD